MKKLHQQLRYALCVLVLLGAELTMAQIKVSGFIKDSDDHEALIGAYAVDTIHKIGTSTNNYGFYTISVPKQAVLRFSFIGYKHQEVWVNTLRDTTLNIYLSKDDLLGEVVVTAGRSIEQSNYTGVEQMRAQTVQKLPAIMGEPDIVKSLTLMPGVSFGNEATSGYFVRGSSSDQNLILLDGVPVYNPYHLKGYFSAFNVDAINSATLYKGAIPAQYGGRLASVLDLNLKEGNMKRLNAKLTLGSVMNKVLIEAPIIKDRTSFLITARRSFLDVYNQTVNSLLSYFSGIQKVADDMDMSQYYFTDYNIKLNHKINHKNRIFFNFYNSQDDYDNKDTVFTMQDTKKWGNTLASARWNKIYSDNIFSNLTLYHSRYQYNAKKSLVYENTSDPSKYSIDYKSAILDYSAKMDFNISINQHHIQFGGQYLYQKFQPAVTAFRKMQASSNIDTTYHYNFNTNTISFYIEDRFKILPLLDVNAGLYASALFNGEMFYPSLQPRISLNYTPHEKLSLKTSYSRMTQNLHLLSNSWSGDPADMWVPSTQKIRPEKANQVDLALVYQERQWAFSAALYAKNMSNLIEYKEGMSYFDNQSDWQSKVETGKGKAYGAEFSVRKKQGKLTGSLSYTYSKSTREFKNQNRGKPFPYTYDRTHNVSAFLLYTFNKSWSVSANWLFASGKPFTIANTYVINDLGYPQTFKQYDRVNNLRMPNYHRLDVGINYTKSYSQFSYNISAGVYNAYNRSNPYYVFEGENTISVNSLLGIMPYLTLSFNFNTK